MQLIQETSDTSKYLTSSEIIDFEDENIQKTAIKLSNDIKDEIRIIKTVYEFVRDEISKTLFCTPNTPCLRVSHSMDINENRVTYKASDVLKYKHGLCLAKSHLLTAILRFLNIPTGFCYQKLDLMENLVYMD